MAKLFSIGGNWGLVSGLYFYHIPKLQTVFLVLRASNGQTFTLMLMKYVSEVIFL